uniref:Uncharacterized protein n=1 Tax=Amphiprion percula TaxID=161767 RepID=A0A3P8RIH7_AMPPE
CLPLWPESSSGKLCVRVVGSESASKSFFFSQQDNGSLLSLDMVSVWTNHSSRFTLTVCWTNHSSRFTLTLKPNEARRFAWDDPTGVRTLRWSYMEHSGELGLLKFPYDNQSQVHWVSFLDGRQRVLLFTEDVAVVTKARQAEELEQFQQEVRVSLQNLGLSLINNSSRQEIAYIGITSSGVVWEMKPKNRWKPFSQKNINLLERTYQDQLSGKTEGGWVRLESNLEVRGQPSPRSHQLSVQCAQRESVMSLVVSFKQSMHQRSLRAQLHWLQVDNQLPGAIFPIIFHPVSPPKSIALDSEPKPFIDVSIITRFNQHSNVMQFKSFTVSVFQSGLIEADLQGLQAELMEASLTDTSGLSFFEHFHISPIKVTTRCSPPEFNLSDSSDQKKRF